MCRSGLGEGWSVCFTSIVFVVCVRSCMVWWEYDKRRMSLCLARLFFVFWYRGIYISSRRFGLSVLVMRYARCDSDAGNSSALVWRLVHPMVSWVLLRLGNYWQL
jgi:hypothetical protein